MFVDDEIEYRNECWLKHTACTNGVEIKVHHKGPCSEENDVPLEDKGHLFTNIITILKADIFKHDEFADLPMDFSEFLKLQFAQRVVIPMNIAHWMLIARPKRYVAH